MDENKVLIVEDDPDIRSCVRILLESEGYSVEEAENGREGIGKLTETLDLIILDIMLPGMNGLSVCEEIRKLSMVPVLFLTAKSQESDRMFGLMAGGDDYLTKPFSYAELLGRTKALIRRYNVYKGKMDISSDKGYLELNRIKIHKEYNEVFINGCSVDLTNIEYNILHLLMSHPGRIYSAQNIYENVWNEPYFYSCNGTVMVHIRKLRMKVEKNPQEPEYVKTVWGRGYRFDEGKR